MGEICRHCSGRFKSDEDKVVINFDQGPNYQEVYEEHQWLLCLDCAEELRAMTFAFVEEDKGDDVVDEDFDHDWMRWVLVQPTVVAAIAGLDD